MSLWNVFKSETAVEIQGNPSSKGTLLKWSHTHPCFVMGNDTGDLLFYNNEEQTKYCKETHEKKIHDGDWNNEGFLGKILKNLSLLKKCIQSQ